MTPMWYQVGATILGGEMALKYGWAICLSGGMHHASSDDGGGWCVFSDISISIKNFTEHLTDLLPSFLIVGVKKSIVVFVPRIPSGSVFSCLCICS